MVSQVVWSNGPNDWKLKLSTDDKFIMSDLKGLTDEKLTVLASNLTIWLQLVPIKCIGFVWKACLGRILTRAALSKRGIKVPSSFCLMCINEVDTANHILLNSPIVFDALVWIFNWCDIYPQKFISIFDFVNFVVTWGNCPQKRKIFLAIC